MLYANINIHTTHPVIVTQFTNHSQTQTKTHFKSLYVSYDTELKIPDELAAKFYSLFQKSKTEKYNHKKVKKILLEAISAFKRGHYLSSYSSSEYRYADIRARNNQRVYFKLPGQARIWFDEIATGTDHKNNKQRRYVLFSLLEAAFLQYVPVNEKVIN
ncbi:MAG: hypothetical protein ACTH4U_11650 [Pseudoalteromonas prydzensis]|uniref:hypothetical protein n=1 Tax=Pseudoalteromonas prydzensis TaxID=182141 RepID=UPI003F9D744F